MSLREDAVDMPRCTTVTELRHDDLPPSFHSLVTAQLQQFRYKRQRQRTKSIIQKTIQHQKRPHRQSDHCPYQKDARMGIIRIQLPARSQGVEKMRGPLLLQHTFCPENCGFIQQYLPRMHGMGDVGV